MTAAAPQPGAGPSGGSERRRIIGWLSLCFIPLAGGPLGLLMLTATAMCGNVCDQVDDIWSIALLILAAILSLLLWLFVSLWRNTVSTPLLIAVIALDGLIASAYAYIIITSIGVAI